MPNILPFVSKSFNFDKEAIREIDVIARIQTIFNLQVFRLSLVSKVMVRL